MLRKNKHCFTLLEITLAMVILSLIGIATSIQIYGAVRSYRFQTEASSFYQALKEAQALAITYATDVECLLEKKKGVWSYKLISEEPLFPLNRKERKFAPDTELWMNQKLYAKKRLYLLITGTGRIEPHPTLALSQKERQGPSYLIDLKTPIQITFRTVEGPS